ncbi:MAG: (2Fe-2S)-binding protein [Sphingomonadales bacterium]|nr:(2Fe-2S)-binding protein [Sphingomonadales bacterium]
MAQVTFIAHDGAVITIDCAAGQSLMEGARAGGIDGIEAVCGGNAYCGTCRCYVDAAWRGVTGAVTEIELPMIETAGDGTPGVRLSCQIAVTDKLDGLIVRLPDSQM